MLNFRQKRAYRHTCNLWRLTRSINTSTGAPGENVYTIAYRSVQCLYQFSDNVSDPTPSMGRTKRPTIYTTDTIHFDAAQEIDEGWLIQNTTGLPSGSNSSMYGQFHVVLGDPRVIENAGSRKANKLSVMAQVVEKLPAGVE